MPSNLEDVYRLLIHLLLKGPRDPRKTESAVYRRNEQFMGRFGLAGIESPVVGVAMAPENSIDILLFHDIEGFSKEVTDFFRLDAFRIG
jgi:hypothetical protein